MIGARPKRLDKPTAGQQQASAEPISNPLSSEAAVRFRNLEQQFVEVSGAVKLLSAFCQASNPLLWQAAAGTATAATTAAGAQDAQQAGAQQLQVSQLPL